MYDPALPDSIDVGKLLLLFEFLFVPFDKNPVQVQEIQQDTSTEPFVVPCAFVQYYLPFADSRNRPLRNERQGTRVKNTQKWISMFFTNFN